MFREAWELLTYRVVSKQESEPHSGSLDNQEHRSTATSTEAATLERIIKQQHCPPLSLKDLFYFCDYVEFTTENLLFYLDFLDYVEKWNALSVEEKASSPMFEAEKSRRLNLATKKNDSPQIPNLPRVPLTSSSEISSTSSSLDLSSPPSYNTVHSMTENIASLSASSPVEAISAVENKHTSEITMDETTTFSHKRAQPVRDCPNHASTMSLPLRSEIDRLIAVYLLSTSRHELNLSYAMRETCLGALERTSHPNALRPVADHIHMLLCRSTLPNFLHYASRNANRPRRWYAFAISILTLLIVLGLTILNIVQKKPKLMRAIGIPSLWFGTTCLLAACRGSCFILALRRQVQSRPYYTENTDSSESALDFAMALNHPGTSRQPGAHLDGSPKIVGWRKKSLFRKIFGQSQTTAGLYRHMQNAMVVQCIVQGLLITIICSLIVALIPVRD